MKQLFTIFFYLLMLSGCVSTEPLNSTDFAEITTIDALVGAYNNEGDGGPDAYGKLYLSKLLWPNDKTLDHKVINIISVTKKSANILLVKALNDSVIVKTQDFLEGNNFKIDDGEIILDGGIGIAGLKPGELVLGIYAGGTSIGIDKNGDGKYQSSAAVVGLAALVIPIAAGGSQDVRFNRIK